MIATLFGGGLSGQVDTLLTLILDEIRYSGCKQVLLIPFARLDYTKEPEWHTNWYHEYFDLKAPEIEFLDARRNDDLAKASNSLIYLSGGIEKELLLNSITGNTKLKKLVYSAPYIVAEFGGAMALGQYSRKTIAGAGFVPGLGILADTIIEPHFIEKNRHDQLVREMNELDLTFGIGVDSNSGIRIDTSKPYGKATLLGNKKVEILTVSK